MWTRRKAINRFLCGTALGVLTSPGRGVLAGFLAEDEISPAERKAMAIVAADFMNRFAVPGLSVAVARSGRLVYQEAFGASNRDSGARLSPSNILRIASVTKPITSVAVFTLIEKGKLRLDDSVFGKGGILGTRYGTPPYKRYVESITVDHLLTHTGGGWDNGSGDPMFSNPGMDQPHLISWTLDNRSLIAAPGAHWAYSNFGYCILGRVIEAVTQQSYHDYVREAVLLPCGITNMRIARSDVEHRAPDEVTYYGQAGEDPYGMNIERMDSHGGWAASPTDLIRFATHVDGLTSAPSILKLATIGKMTSHCDVNANYARGWAVNSTGNWWHNGSLPGTTAILVRTSTGFCWAALTNSRSQPGRVIDGALDRMMWEIVGKVNAWRI
jgi:CubicO group peptidase (beta-lactamase class C family)